MNRQEWRDFHGISDADMERIEHALAVFSGVENLARIVRVWDVKVYGKWGDREKGDTK